MLEAPTSTIAESAVSSFRKRRPKCSPRIWSTGRPRSAALSLVDSTAISSAPGMRGASKWRVTTVLPTEPE
ncbi:hypothetical protein G6F68_018977 [Rhizopus microsporus]|nr:hypothetical protein G6F68_018977 [Rhizopus microsporus]